MLAKTRKFVTFLHTVNMIVPVKQESIIPTCMAEESMVFKGMVVYRQQFCLGG